MQQTLSAKEWALLLASPLSIAFGGALGNRIKLSAQTSSTLLNVTAGITTVALAQEIFPAVVALDSAAPNVGARRWAAAFGLVLGVVLMLATRYLFEVRPAAAQMLDSSPPAERSPAPPSSTTIIHQSPAGARSTLADYHHESAPYPTTAVVAAGLDVFIDGLLTGSQVGRGEASVPLALALGVPNGLLSLSITEHMKARHVAESSRLLTTGGLTLTAVLGELLGYAGGRRLKRGSPGLVALMGFAAVVVTWLITQELLPEAQRVRGTALSGPAAFFGGIGGGILLEWFAA